MSDILDSIREQYDKNKANNTSYDNAPDFSKYFAVRLEDTENEGESQIRVMPTKDGESPFVEGYWHSIQVGGKWKKLYCKKENDNEECPLCSVEAELKATGSEEDKKISRQFSPRKFYIVKLIDRSNEGDGVKFWRFPHNYKGEGALDKIIPIFTKKGDITHPREGRDIVLILGRDNKKYTKIMSIMSEDVSLLTDDTKKAKTWLADTTEWRDVYRAQPTDYLQIIADGDTPVWDKQLERFIAKGETAEVEAEASYTPKPVTTTTESSTTEDDDELPF